MIALVVYFAACIVAFSPATAAVKQRFVSERQASSCTRDPMQSYARKTGSKQSLLQKVSRKGPMVSAILLIVSTGVVGEVIPSNSSMYSLEICVHCVGRVQLLAWRSETKRCLTAAVAGENATIQAAKYTTRAIIFQRIFCDGTIYNYDHELVCWSVGEVTFIF